ncbi:hypothetical protein Ciccas_007072 [Cichlidogyrus casuarinus]|uniref:Uncharacterized protein n=1 Tax=Cichlidogyrus casuarinus TaxID=1844966 RepID=A0ABD2Q3X4_9PLAT
MTWLRFRSKFPCALMGVDFIVTITEENQLDILQTGLVLCPRGQNEETPSICNFNAPPEAILEESSEKSSPCKIRHSSSSEACNKLSPCSSVEKLKLETPLSTDSGTATVHSESKAIRKSPSDAVLNPSSSDVHFPRPKFVNAQNQGETPKRKSSASNMFQFLMRKETRSVSAIPNSEVDGHKQNRNIFKFRKLSDHTLRWRRQFGKFVSYATQDKIKLLLMLQSALREEEQVKTTA